MYVPFEEEYNAIFEQALIDKRFLDDCDPFICSNHFGPNGFMIQNALLTRQWNEFFNPPVVPVIQQAEDVNDDPLDLVTAREPDEMNDIDVTTACDILSTADELTDDEMIALEPVKDGKESKRKKMKRFLKECREKSNQLLTILNGYIYIYD